MFEELSGSSVLKPECDDYLLKISQCDEQMKHDSESLQALRLEKVKQKGLQEFADQMNDCLKEQKDTEAMLHLSEILLAEKSIAQLQGSLAEYEEGLHQTDQVKTELVKDIKKYEAEARKAINQEEDQQRKVKSKKDELLDFQSSSQNKQKLIDSTKAMITQKKSMLQREQNEANIIGDKRKVLN